MARDLTKEIAYEALVGFFRGNKPFVFFGTGASISVDNGFGMEELKHHLCEEIKENSLTLIQKTEWKRVVESLNRGDNLELALDNLEDEGLIMRVIELTAAKVGKLTRQFYKDILSGKSRWLPLSLFKKLVRGLPETDRVLHVATTNYDLLAEAAFEKGKIPYTTGFYGGILRKLDWEKALKSMKYSELTKKKNSKKLNSVTKSIKHIRLYKVHGSLNTFLIDNEIIETDFWIDENPGDNIIRVMITPGAQKYKRLHEYRSILLREYDAAVEKHLAFLFIGFGFNDAQLFDRSFKNKLANNKCPVLIITRDKNEHIVRILKENDNAWLVCKSPGTEENETLISNSGYHADLILEGKKLWDTENFALEILGG